MPPSPPPPPPSPPPSPPPPSPPSPPSPPPGVCEDTCNANGGIEGECNDGGPGDLKKNVACEYGTDCSDCGVRIFCVECSEECQAQAVMWLGLKEPEKACMHEQWGDGICDSSCNNLVCDHNDCSAKQITEKCVYDQDQTGIAFTSPPESPYEVQSAVVDSDNGYGYDLVPINLQLDLSPARLEIDMNINEMVLTNEIKFVMQWQDKRMALSPCKRVLGNMLSMSRDEAKSDIQRAAKTEYKIRYWIPRLDSTHPVPGFYAFVDEAAYMFEEQGLWQEGIAPNYSLVNASNPTWAHARRRASEEAAAVKRMQEARASGACQRGVHETDVHALQAERHKRRMQSSGNWRDEEQRRLAETVVEGGNDIITEAPCPHCVTWAGEVRLLSALAPPALSPPCWRPTLTPRTLIPLSQAASASTCSAPYPVLIPPYTSQPASSSTW